MNDFHELKYQLRREKERKGEFPDPSPFPRNRLAFHKDCTCKFDPKKLKGMCLTCNGWVD